MLGNADNSQTGVPAIGNGNGGINGSGGLNGAAGANSGLDIVQGHDAILANIPNQGNNLPQSFGNG